MNRSSLFLAVVVVLALAGSVFAQTAPGDADQPGTASTQPGTSVPVVQGDSPDTQPTSPGPGDTTGTPSSEPYAAQPPADGAPLKPDSTGGGVDQTQSGLPATASNNPLMLAAGVLSLLAFVTLLLYRRNRTARS